MRIRNAHTLLLAPPILLITLTISITAQQQRQGAPPTSASPATTVAAATSSRGKVIITANSTPQELARAAFEAHGGDKFRSLQNIVLLGSVDVYSSTLPTTLSGKFAMITAGERYRLEVQVPGAPLIRQIYDGQQAYSSIPRAEIPPPSKFGFLVINYHDRAGYAVTALPDKKKQRAFRITDPEGNATDFYIDATTGRVMACLYKYKNFSFGEENKSFKEFDGVVVPSSISRKLELAGNAYYVEMKAKDVKVNQPLDADVFAIPAQ